MSRTWTAKCWLGSSSGYVDLTVQAATITGAKEQLQNVYGAQQIINLREINPNRDQSSSGGCGGVLALLAVVVIGAMGGISKLTSGSSSIPESPAQGPQSPERVEPEPAPSPGPQAPAEAPTQQAFNNKCWYSNGGESLNYESCSITKRINSNGHTVFDLNGPDRETRSVILWNDKTSESIRNGESERGTWEVDSDGDIRVYMGSGNFAFQSI